MRTLQGTGHSFLKFYLEGQAKDLLIGRLRGRDLGTNPMSLT